MMIKKILLGLFLFFGVLNTGYSESENPYSEFRVETYNIQEEYLKRIAEHQSAVMSDLEVKLVQQRWQTNVIAVMVILMVLVGLYLSYLQFKSDSKTGEKSSFSFKIGSGVFEVNSSVIGLAILAMSFWFFQTYIDRVYSVEVFTIAPIDMTTFGQNH